MSARRMRTSGGLSSVLTPQIEPNPPLVGAECTGRWLRLDLNPANRAQPTAARGQEAAR